MSDSVSPGVAMRLGDMTAHGGTIVVESEIGKGSEFQVRLPL